MAARLAMSALPQKRTSGGRALAGNLSQFLNGAVWSQVVLEDVGLDPLGRNDHCPGRYQTHTSDQVVELYQIGDVICLVSQGICEAARSLLDEVVVKRLQLGPFAFEMAAPTARFWIVRRMTYRKILISLFVLILAVYALALVGWMLRLF